MAYSTSPSTIESLGASLDELKAGRSAAWTVQPGKEHYWARRVREALYIARLHPKRFPELARASSQFTIKVVSPTRVEAVPKDGVKPETTALGPTLDSDEPGPQHTGTQPFGKPVSTVALTTALQVVNSWIKHLPSNDPINFQETVLSQEELVKLHTWAQARTPKLMFFVFEGSLTLAVAEDDVIADSWHPPVVSQPETFDI